MINILKKTKSGKKIVLRFPNAEDAKNLISYFNLVGGETDYLLFGKNEFRLSLEEEKKHIEKMNSETASCIIIGLINNQIVASAQLIQFTRDRIKHNADFSISVRKEFWDDGIATLILEEIISYAKSSQKISAIHLSVSSNNNKAIYLYEKFGFIEVGKHKNKFFVNDVYYDEMLMDLYL